LKGEWGLVGVDPVESTGTQGTVTFDGNGKVTAGSLVTLQYDFSPTLPVYSAYTVSVTGGTYTVAADNQTFSATLNINAVTDGAPTTFTINGTISLNQAIAMGTELDNTTFTQNVIALVAPQTNASNASVTGTYNVFEQDVGLGQWIGTTSLGGAGTEDTSLGAGSLVTDGNGTVTTFNLFVPAQFQSGGELQLAASPASTYAVTATGQVTATLNLNNGSPGDVATINGFVAPDGTIVSLNTDQGGILEFSFAVPTGKVSGVTNASLNGTYPLYSLNANSNGGNQATVTGSFTFDGNGNYAPGNEVQQNVAGNLPNTYNVTAGNYAVSADGTFAANNSKTQAAGSNWIALSEITEFICTLGTADVGGTVLDPGPAGTLNADQSYIVGISQDNNTVPDSSLFVLLKP
jgi:hypothetical protein